MRRQLLISFAAAAAATAVGGFVTASADNLASFTCTGKSGGVNGVPGRVTSIRVAHHNGYDRLVLEFAPSAAGSIPAYTLAPQASSTFTRDASGQSVKLDGSAGVKTVLRNTTVGSLVPSDLRSALPAIREVASVGDFERVVSYGVGLSSSACFRVLELSGPTRLAIDVQTSPDAVQSTASVPWGTAPTAVPAVQAADTTPSELATTGRPQVPTHPNGLPLAEIALGLLVLTGGLALVHLRHISRR